MNCLKQEKEGRTKEYINQMLYFLDEYTKQHFRDEEAYMEKIGYPGLDDQKESTCKFC
jgi:hemerythrin